MRRIKRLSNFMVNQIAAGEVIERPSSVMKELLENSLDAGATQLTIVVEKAGQQLLQVRDNGHGIHKEDLSLALTTHATSKIREQQDLTAIYSLGFRGEALASISSVARLQLAASVSDDGLGWQLSQKDPEGEPEIESVAHGRGTTVTVRDLFYNTPARRRFLRTQKTEWLHILDVVNRIGLSRFDVGIKLTHNGRQVIHWPQATNEAQQRNRLASILGKRFVDQAIAIDIEATGLQLSGWVAQPSYFRSSRDQQFIFLNGRMIRDPLIFHAVNQAYSEQLYPGRQPAYVLYLTVDPETVDVNVHPTKHEVRFQQSRLIHDFVCQCVQKALAGGTVEVQLPVSTNPIEFDVPSSNEATFPLAWGQPMGCLKDRYWLFGHEKGLLIVDSWRLWRQQVREALQQRSIEQAGLLVPSIRALESAPSAQPGFEVSQLSDSEWVMRAAPKVLNAIDEEARWQFFLRETSLEALQPPMITKSDLIPLLAHASSPHAVRLLDWQALEQLDVSQA